MPSRAKSSTVWIVAVLLLATLIPFWRCIAFGHSVGPFDQIQQLSPWNGPKPDRPWDVLQADGVLQFYGWRDLVFEAWSQREFPFWNHYVLGGTPLLANSQSGALYPFHAAVGALGIPTGTGLFLLAWFHLLVAGVGTGFLVRRLGGSRAGAVLGGLSFALSPFMLAWAALPSVIETVAWLPFVLTGLAGLFRHRDQRGVYGAMLGGSTGLMLLAGHLQFAAYGLMAAVLFALALLILELRSREKVAAPVGWTALLLAVGVGMSAPQLLPVLEFSKFSHRRNVPTEEGYSAYVASALKPTDFVSRLANPYGQGNPNEFVDPSAPYSQFWPAISRQGANYAESALTVGPLVILLLALGLGVGVKRRGASALVAIAVVGALLAIGSRLDRLLYFDAPGWSSTGSPGRAICLFVLGLSALAGLLVPDDWSIIDKKRLGISLGVGSVLCLVTLSPIIDAAPNGVNAEAWSALTAGGAATAPNLLIAVILSAAGIFAMSKGEVLRMSAAAGLPIVVAVVLGAANHVRTGDASFLRNLQARPEGRVAVVPGDWGLLQTGKTLLPPNLLTVRRIPQIGGYDSLLNKDSQAILAQIDGEDPAPPANGNMMFIKRNVDPIQLGEAGVTEIWSLSELSQFGEPFDSSGGFLRYRVRGPGYADTVAGPAPAEWKGPNEVHLKAMGKGRLVVRERNMPGWRATVDGKPTEISNGRWIELNLTPGEHQVVLRYTAPGFYPGLALGALCLIVLLGVTIAGNVVGPKASAVESELGDGSSQ